MKTPNCKAERPAAPAGRETGVRPAILIAAGAVCLACVVLVAIVHLARVRGNQQAQDEAPVAAATPAATSQTVVSHPAAPQQWSLPVASVGQQSQSRAFDYHTASTASTSGLVQSLASLDLTAGTLTEEQAAAWKDNLRQLVQQGISAVPAIREFLESNTDLKFGPEAAATLGYASLRMALFDALTQIGTPVSEAVLDESLQNTTNQQEISQLALDLNKLSPGTYQRDVLGSTRQTLALAAGGSLPNNADVAPLFQVLQQYGGADVVPDLEASAGQWNYYAAIALAQLPDGAGVPSLIQIADGPQNNARTAALEMLTGMASSSGASQDALVKLVQQNSLSAYDWATLVPFLAGNQMVFQGSAFGNSLGAVDPNIWRKTLVSSSNQSFFTGPIAALTPAQIQQQLALLDRLISLTTNPSAIQALLQAKAQLQGRLGLLASTATSN